MKYFTLVTAPYVAKNKAQKSAEEFIRKYDRLIIEPVRIDGFISTIKSGIKEINELHPRCTDLEVSYYRHYKYKNEWIVQCIGLFSLHVYHSRN